MQFNDLNIIPEIQKALIEESYSNPTPIQAEAIPIILESNDLLGCAQTGTGKTAAFAIPILQLLMRNKSYERQRPIKSLILTPTRELAIQIEESFKAYGRHLPLTTAVIFGGVKQTPQTELLKRGVDILIATPGRLLDLINQGFINLKHIDIFVLDEADRMLDMGFIHDVKKVIALLPKQRQNLFFSATMPPEVVKLANTILHKPKEVSVTPVSSTAEIIEQFIYFVDKENKNALLVEVLKNQAMKSVLVFARAKHGADKIAKILNKQNIKAEAIHGDKGQSTRQKALQNFKSGTTRVLVATDIVARGIDIDDLAYVINFDLPNIAETYVHRIGRTGRAGTNGTAISFCHADEKPYLKDIEKLIAKKITVVEEHPFPLMNHNPVKPPAPQSRKKQTAHERPKEQVQTPAQKHNFRSKKSKQR